MFMETPHLGLQDLGRGSTFFGARPRSRPLDSKPEALNLSPGELLCRGVQNWNRVYGSGFWALLCDSGVADAFEHLLSNKRLQ